MKSKATISIQKNKCEAIESLTNYLDGLIGGKDDKQKKANLISYWLKDYVRYLKSEETFNPLMQENYKRGNVVKINLGFNIGNEEGGLHYAIVINNPAKSSGNVTVVPLTSKKNNIKYNSATVNLGYGIIENILTKLEQYNEQLLKMQADLKYIKDEKVRKEKEVKIKKTINELSKYTCEARNLKTAESVALVGNIMTISKQRIYTPTIRNRFLKGVTITNEQLD